jgi:hypothetical protein
MTEEEMHARIAELETQNEKLKADKSTAIGEKNRAKAEAAEAKEAQQREKDDAAAKTGDVEGLKAAHAREIKKLQDQLAERDTSIASMLIDNAIASKAVEAGVFPHLVDGFTAMMKMAAKVENGQAMVGDHSLADHMSSYLASANGKNFYPAPQNGGGGATGSTAKATTNSKQPETADEWNTFFKLTNDNPALANSLAEQWGRPELKV